MAYLYRAKKLTRLSRGRDLWDETEQATPGMGVPWMKSVVLAAFGGRQFLTNTSDSPTQFEWQANDVLLLVTACPSELGLQHLEALLTESLSTADFERSARQLFEAIERRAGEPRSTQRWLSQGAVLLARAE